MKNLVSGIIGGAISFSGFIGYALYKKSKSKVRISINFDDDHRENEKRFIDIWKNNRKYFSHMWISEDERYSFGPHHTRRYSFHVDERGLNLLDGFIIHF